MLCHICGNFVRGAVLGAYQVLELLGMGRSGRAYRAVYARRQQTVTLKLYSLDTTSMNFWTLAQQEMNQVRQLHHPFILPVQSTSLWHSRTNLVSSSSQGMLLETFQRGVSGEEKFMLVLSPYAPASISQFLDTMSSRRMGTQAVSSVQLFIEQASNALGAAHRQGLTHGSLVPGNVLLGNQQHLWIADFGLARLHPPPPPYLAPELVPYVKTSARGGEWMQWNMVTPASDQYAFAVLCWQWLTPFIRIDSAVTAILQKAMQPNPGARFATIDEFASHLLAQLQQLVYRAREMEQRVDTPRSFPRSTLPPSDTPAAGMLQVMRPSPSWMQRGDTCFAEHKYEEAIYAYKRALEEDRGNATAWIALGDAHFALEQYAEALRAYDDAIKVNANDATAWFNRGTVLDALGRHSEAEICYARSQLLSER